MARRYKDENKRFIRGKKVEIQPIPQELLPQEKGREESISREVVN